MIIKGSNGAFATDLPNKKLKTIIWDIRDHEIKSVTLTSSGYYCVVWGRNGYSVAGPDELKEKIREAHDNCETIFSVSISENGNWAMVTDKQFDASHSADLKAFRLAKERYGQITSVCISNHGFCAVCERGVFYTNIPNVLEEELKSIKFKPANIFFLDDGTYFIADKDGDMRSTYL